MSLCLLVLCVLILDSLLMNKMNGIILASKYKKLTLSALTHTEKTIFVHKYSDFVMHLNHTKNTKPVNTISDTIFSLCCIST